MLLNECPQLHKWKDRQIGQTHSWTQAERFGFFYFCLYFDFNFYCIHFGATSCDATPHKLYIIWLDFASFCCCCFRWMAKVFLREEPLGQSTSSLAVLLTDVETNATLMNSLWSALADRQIYSYSIIWQADREIDRQSCWRFLVAMLPSSLLAVFMTSSLNWHRWNWGDGIENFSWTSVWSLSWTHNFFSSVSGRRQRTSD